MPIETVIGPQIDIALWLTACSLALTVVILLITAYFACRANKYNTDAKDLETKTKRNVEALRLLKMAAGAGEASSPLSSEGKRRPHLPLQLMAASLLRNYPEKKRAITAVRQQLISFRNPRLDPVIIELQNTLQSFHNRK